MMGKTHMIAGIGAAVLILPPDTIGGCLQALLGGALGGLICDLDVQSSTYCRDARVVRNTALLLGAVILIFRLEMEHRNLGSYRFPSGEQAASWTWDFSGDNHCRKAVLPQKLYPFFPGTGVFDGCVLLSVCSADPLCGSRLSFPHVFGSVK